MTRNPMLWVVLPYYLVGREVELVPESEHEVVIRMHDLLSVYFDNLDDLTASFRGVDPIFETL